MLGLVASLRWRIDPAGPPAGRAMVWVAILGVVRPMTATRMLSPSHALYYKPRIPAVPSLIVLRGGRGAR